MLNLKELRQQRAAKAARGKAATTEFNTLSKKAELTADESTRMAALDAELNTLEADIETLDTSIVAEETRARRAGLFVTTAEPVIHGRSAGRTVDEPNPETTFGFKGMAEFAGAVRMAQVGGQFDPRLNGALDANAPATFNQNGGSGAEGFLVPPDYSKSVYEIAFEATDLVGMASPEPTSSNSVFKPKDETTPWGAVGVQAVWAAEAAQLVATKLSMSGDLMPLHKLYAFTAATDEILADAPMIQDRLTRQAGRAIKWTASDAIMWGNAIGKPLGFMNAPSLVTVAKDAGQATATLSVNNLLTMLAHMLRFGGTPVWLINPDVLPQLGQLTIGNVPAWLPFNQPMAGSPFEGRLLGFNVMFTEHAQTLGTLGDVTLANLDGYYAATKAGGGVDFASSIHLYFDQGLTAFRWTFRIAGQPYLSKPIQPAKGATAKSHFIALAARP